MDGNEYVYGCKWSSLFTFQLNANNNTQPERIQGGQYTIRSDVWSSGLTLLTLAQNRFPYPDDLIGIIELINYITKEEIPQLKDEEPDENGHGEVRWSDEMKDFINVWYVIEYTVTIDPG